LRCPFRAIAPALGVLQMGRDLLDRQECIGAIRRPCFQVEERHALLERIAVDMEDLCILCGLFCVFFQLILRYLLLQGLSRSVGPRGALLANCSARPTICLIVPPRLDLRRIPAVLGHNRLLVGDVLDPMHPLRPVAPHLHLEREGHHARKDQHGGPPRAGIVHRLPERLRSDVDVHQHALGFARVARVAVGHGHGQQLRRAGHDAREAVGPRLRAAEHGL
jgi:hypothetical protein